jgi:hypothetical protein
MQVSTLTKDNIPIPNHELMQQACTPLMVPSYGTPKKEQLGSWKGASGVRQTASWARSGVFLHNEIRSRQNENELFYVKVWWVDNVTSMQVFFVHEIARVYGFQVYATVADIVARVTGCFGVHAWR